MQAYGMDQLEDLFDDIGALTPTGVVVDLVVTGVIRSPQDVSTTLSVPDVVYLGSAEVHLGAAFHRAHWRVDVPSLGVLFGDDGGGGGEDVAGYELHVDVDELTRQELTEAVRALDPEAAVDLTPSEATQADGAERSIRLQALALLGFGALVAVGGGFLAAQAIGRLESAAPGERESLRAAGITTGTLTTLGLIRGAVIGTVGAALAVLVAVLGSPLTPIGAARRAEVDPGIDLDGPVAATGAALLVLLVVALSAAYARREAGRPGPAAAHRRTGLTERAARLGMPVQVVSGIRTAQLGGGRSVALVVLVAVAGVAGGLTFAASEGRLARDPGLWGWTFDAVIGDGNDPTLVERSAAGLRSDQRIAASAAVHDLDDVSVSSGDGSADVEVAALEGLEGRIEPRMLAGEPPGASDEVVLGRATADRLHVSIGDEVQLDVGDGPAAFEVGGLAVFNLGFDSERIGEGVLLTPEGIERAGGELLPMFILVEYARGVDPEAMYEDLRAEFGNVVLRPIPTLELHHLDGVRNLPVAFSLVVAVVAALALALVLGRTVRRRRRDLAVLRTLGFETRQLRATIAVQAAVLVVPAAVLGAVLGVGAGRVAWTQVARSLGAPEVQVVPLLAVLLAVVGALVLANVIAAGPARVAGRTRPAAVLRAE
jgi:hypothetical protein